MTMLSSAVRRGAATMLALALTLGAGVVAAQDASAVPITVRDPVQRADQALAKARTLLANDHPGRAVDALLVVKHQIWLANKAAMAQIGKPPKDPESDDPPGPPAVFAVLAVDHRVATTVVPLFDGQARPRVVDTLLLTLRATQGRRDALLAKVIALPAENGRDDYTDDMADRLSMFNQEVKQVSTALSTYSLTPDAQRRAERRPRPGHRHQEEGGQGLRRRRVVRTPRSQGARCTPCVWIRLTDSG